MRIANALIFSAATAAIALAGCASTASRTMNEKSNSLTPCSGAPNCVSSVNAKDSSRHVDPFAFDGTKEQAHAALLDVLRAQKDAQIEADDMPTVRATFRTTIGFVDDVTFVFRDDADMIDVKSGSRLGLFDWGVNGRRVESLRLAFKRRMVEGNSAN